MSLQSAGSDLLEKVTKVFSPGFGFENNKQKNSVSDSGLKKGASLCTTVLPLNMKKKAKGQGILWHLTEVHTCMRSCTVDMYLYGRGMAALKGGKLHNHVTEAPDEVLMLIFSHLCDNVTTLCNVACVSHQ
jgi:hypothetical protein